MDISDTCPACGAPSQPNPRQAPTGERCKKCGVGQLKIIRSVRGEHYMHQRVGCPSCGDVLPDSYMKPLELCRPGAKHSRHRVRRTRTSGQCDLDTEG